ncbi:MAG: hypothetical protein ACREQ9_06430 [Candidatus Binatia bacterium]
MPEFARILSRAYPRAAPGRLSMLASDPAAGTLELAGLFDGHGGGELDLWAPSSGAEPPLVTGTGVGDFEILPSAGGFRIRAVAHADYSVHLVPSSAVP